MIKEYTSLICITNLGVLFVLVKIYHILVLIIYCSLGSCELAMACSSDHGHVHHWTCPACEDSGCGSQMVDHNPVAPLKAVISSALVTLSSRHLPRKEYKKRS